MVEMRWVEKIGKGMGCKSVLGWSLVSCMHGWLDGWAIMGYLVIRYLRALSCIYL